MSTTDIRTTRLPVCQVALSVPDASVLDWYQQTFGLLVAGQTFMSGPDLARLQHLPVMAAEMKWMLDRQPDFELEFFVYEQPIGRPLPEDWSALDVGYTSIGIHVQDFDAALMRCHATGPVACVGAAGQRRASVRQPDGAFVELLEENPVGGTAFRDSPAVVRTVRLTVPDLKRALEVFEVALGLRRIPSLHTPEDEVLWGNPGDIADVAALDAGPVVLELVEYSQKRERRRWGLDRHADLGLVHVALRAADSAEFANALGRLSAAGCSVQTKDFGYSKCAYLLDPQGFTFELLKVPEITGFPEGEDS